MTPAPIVIVCPAAVPAPIDPPRMLLALSRVENPKQDVRAVGPRGERGLWQMKESTWKDTTGWPFSLATDPAVSRCVARTRLIFCEAELQKAGLAVSVRNMALVWREGLSAVINHKFQPKAVRDYAIRVESIYRDR